MKVSEQRKHKVNEKSSRKLCSELLAFYYWCLCSEKNITNINIVRNAPSNPNIINTIPMISVNDRNSTVFLTHSSPLLLDQYPKGNFTQLDKSGVGEKWNCNSNEPVILIKPLLANHIQLTDHLPLL